VLLRVAAVNDAGTTEADVRRLETRARHI